MSGTDDRLVYMANQIAAAFRHQAPDKAIAATYDHIWHFWDPRMRQRLLEHLDRGGGGLDEIARGAVARLRSDREPAPITQATRFTSIGDAAAASDAG